MHPAPPEKEEEPSTTLLEPSTSPCSPDTYNCHATSFWEAFGHKVTTRGTNQGAHRRECSHVKGPAGLLAPLLCSKEGCPSQKSPGPRCSLCLHLSVFSSQDNIVPSCFLLNSLTGLLGEATIGLHMALSAFPPHWVNPRTYQSLPPAAADIPIPQWGLKGCLPEPSNLLSCLLLGSGTG